VPVFIQPQSEQIDLAPRFGDLFSLDSIDHESGKRDGPAGPRNSFESPWCVALAVVRSTTATGWSLRSDRGQRIYSRRAARRNITGERGDGGQQRRGGRNRNRVV
jgi:hypothetical protein